MAKSSEFCEKVMEVSPVHPWNAQSPIFLRLSGKIKEVIPGQLENAENCNTRKKPLGANVTEIRFVQPLNAWPAIISRLSGKVMEVRFV